MSSRSLKNAKQQFEQVDI